MNRFRPRFTCVKLCLSLVAALACLTSGEYASAAEPLGSITEFSAGLNAGSTPQGIVAGPDGNLWFADNAFSGTSAIGRINPGTQAIEEFDAGLNAGSSPFGIAAGGDGNLWFADQGTTDAIGRVTPAGTITEFTTGLNPDSEPFWIAAGPDGNLWFTDRGSPGAIGRINPSTLAITEFSTGLNPQSVPQQIVAGSDGSLWFTDVGNTKAIGRITTAGTIVEFSDGLPAGTNPGPIAAGSDGNLWFTDEVGTSAIGRINPTTQAITEFSAGLTPDAGIIGIAAGPDGALWFPERNDPPDVPKIGRISTAGAITEFGDGLNPGSGPRLITAGPDGNMWFTDNGETTAAIGRIGTRPPPSNSFSLGKLKRNRRKGTAKLPVEVPGPGTLTLSGKGLTQQSVTAPAGEVRLRIVSKGKKRRSLDRKGKAKVGAKITYTPDGGSPNTQSRRIKLLKRASR